MTTMASPYNGFDSDQCENVEWWDFESMNQYLLIIMLLAIKKMNGLF